VGVTSRLYYNDSFLKTFRANVTDTAEDGRVAYLDQTAFYPTSGGQLFDLGTLNGIAVVDVADEEHRIAHRLASPIEPGLVEGVIDWTRRFDHMQQHTGQHLLSAVIGDHFGWETVSVHLGRESATADFAVGSIPADVLEKVERIANEEIVANRPVRVSYEDAARAQGLRKPPARAGEIRIVEIEGLDRMACGGTHVRATGEVGSLLILGTEKIRQATRVEFLCGFRVLDHTHRETAARKALEADLRAQLAAMDKERRRLALELAGVEGRERYAASAPRSDGRRVWIEQRGSIDEAARAAAMAFVKPGQALCAFLAGDSLLVACSPDSGWDANSLIRSIAIRGGGSPVMAQGSVADSATARAAIETLLHDRGDGN
jgi:alanyl-tRNA synthetase